MVYFQRTWRKAFLQATRQPDETEIVVNLDVAHKLELYLATEISLEVLDICEAKLTELERACIRYEESIINKWVNSLFVDIKR
jgi:hypothetical protein